MDAARLRPISLALQAVLVAAVISFVFDLQDRIGLALYSEQFLALVLGCAIAIAFIAPRADAGVPAHDLAAAAIGFLACLYVAIDYPRLSQVLAERPPEGVVLSLVVIALVLEGVRRTAGLSLVLVTLGFVAYALLGHFLPEPFTSRPVDVSRLAVYLGIDANAMFGTPMMVASSVVASFIVLGQILTRCGGGDFFTAIATALMGRYRGGSAKVAVTGSALFGMISGSAVANVAGVGVITIPMMQRAGFSARFAAAVEAVGSTGGQLMPPVMGAAAFLMAQVLQVQYIDVCIAATIPAFLYYLALFVQVDLEAARLGVAGARGEGGAIRALTAGWFFLLPFALLVIAMLSWNVSAERAALYAAILLAALALVVPYRGRRLDPRGLVFAVISTGGALVDLVLICAAAGLVIGILNLTGLATELTLQILALSGNNVVILLIVTALVGLVLGMGMPTVGVYIILATLAAPALIQAGLSPMAAHMFVMYFGMMSMVTPPVALAAFAAANIARTDPWATGWMATRIAWGAFIVPFVFVFTPELLMQGSAARILLALAATSFGIWLGSIAVIGHFAAPVPAWRRGAYFAAALALLLPFGSAASAVWIDLAAFAVGLALLASDWRGRAQRS